MGKGKKKKKKSKEELEAERLAREEEERIAREEAARIAEEQRIAREKAHKERQEFLFAERQAELQRLRKEEEDRQPEVEDLQGRLRSVEQERLEGEDWDQFLACNDRPNASNEAELNTFLQVWKDDSERSFESVLKEVVKVDGIVADVEVLLARALASGDMDTIAHYEKFKVLLRDAQIHKLDAATAHLLNNVGDYTNEKNECKIGRAGGGIKYGLWANVALKAFRLKVVEFPKTGITLDIQKPLALHAVAVRAMFHPSAHVLGGTSAKSDDIPVGGSLHLDLLAMPKRTKNIRGWKMAYISDLTDGVRRMIYPPGAENIAASANSPPLRVKLTLPKTAIVPENPRVACWDVENQCWDSERITDVQYSPETRLLQFHTTVMSTIAVVQKRHVDFPYQFWAIRPTGPSQATFTLRGARFTVKVEVSGDGTCVLTQPKEPELASIIGKSMTVGNLFAELSRKGIHLYPTNEDGQIVGMQPLDDGLEEKIHSDVATIAAAFTCTGSCHNQSLGGRSCAFRIQEAAVIDNATMAAESPRSARSAREAMAMEAGEGDDGEWRTVLYSIDEQKVELEAHVAEPVLMHGVKALLVKAEENEPEFNKEPEPKAETHAYLKFCLEGKCTPEAVENMETCSPKFVEAIGSILRITRPLSFS